MWAYRRSRASRTEGRVRTRGFMLLEVLLSASIVAVGVVFVIGSFITSVKIFKASRSYLRALYLAENKMWEYEETGEIEEGGDEGFFEDYKGAKWTVEAREIDEIPLNETALEVVLEEGGKKRKFSVVTYFGVGE